MISHHRIQEKQQRSVNRVCVTLAVFVVVCISFTLISDQSSLSESSAGTSLAEESTTTDRPQSSSSTAIGAAHSSTAARRGSQRGEPPCKAVGIRFPGLEDASPPPESWTRKPLANENLRVCTWQNPTGKLNFGDDIGLEIVDRILARKFELKWANLHGRLRGKKTKCFLPIGSVYHTLKQGDHAWTIGALEGIARYSPAKDSGVVIHSLRGPITRSRLMNMYKLNISSVSPVLGDSGMLAGCLFPEFDVPKSRGRYKECYIPHTHEIPTAYNQSKSAHVITPNVPWEQVLGNITQCDFVISGSLHGIIISESFGIPARMMLENFDENRLFKYRDYYEATNRNLTFAKSYSEAVEMGPESPIVDFNYSAVLAAFPYELFV